MLCNPFCNPDMLEDLKKCRVMEITPEIWEIEGFAGKNFFMEPPSGNIFIMRDGDLVLMMDSGHHPYYRDKILEVLNKFRREGAKELVLTLSHGHWDHGKNNDIIYEAGYEKVRFLLPEPEFKTINIPSHMVGDMKKVFKYYDPLKSMDINAGLKMMMEWNKAFPEYHDPQYQDTWRKIEALPDEYDAEKTMEAWEANMKNVLCPDLTSYIIEKAEPLKLADREKRVYGGQDFLGWPVGRFFLIHDASQSPGHISVYDPLSKMMINGDATLEINPPFLDCDLNACIDICEKCLRMSKVGEILIATDAHRTSQWWPRSLKHWGLKPLGPMQLVDRARGKEECEEFYQMWVDYFTTLRNEVLQAHSRVGKATVEEIVEELKKSNNRYVIFKLGLSLPNLPSIPGTLVAKVLEENGCFRHEEGNRILFSPTE